MQIVQRALLKFVPGAVHQRQALSAIPLVVAFFVSHAAHAAAPRPEALDFFENSIRPILADHCYACHSAGSEKLKGGLFLDSREGVVKGGDSGPAVLPGDVEGSLLIRAVRYSDKELRMPPEDKKLSSEQIALLEQWVRMGAPHPGVSAKPILTMEEKAATHWAFQRIVEPPVPAVKARRKVQTPVDAFILARLEREGLTLSKPADKRTLLRRVTYDLTGLPPTWQELRDFENDRSSGAFERVVQRLLDSPHYGERWARHWLDVARYSDTKGYVFEEERRYPYSYTYRDYVIRAFNEDLPFDRFIVEQLAADQLELGEDKRALAAMGFLTLGRRFLNNQHDIIDDRIDVVTRGLMGLTVACARCHDHKYDPIPAADYYSLYGVFASSTEPSEKPLLGSKSLPKEYESYRQEREKRERELAEFTAEKHLEVRTQLRRRAGDYLLAAHESEKLGDRSKAEGLARERKLDPQTVQRWVRSLKQWREQEQRHPILGPWLTFTEFSEEEFAAKSASYCPCDESVEINPQVRRFFGSKTPENLKELAGLYSKLFEDVDKKWQAKLEEHKKNGGDNPLPSALEAPEDEAIRQLLYAEDSPAHVPEGELARMFDVPAAQKSRRLRRNLEELDATHPGSPPRGMVMVDKEVPVTPKVFLRGNPGNHGPEVPRQFPAIVSIPTRQPFSKGSGRLEMAEAIASPNNPLTARVLVNRVWQQYFGNALVATPSDFGVRSEPPSHPELLDYLAARFMKEGWSLKKLHRLIVLSGTYQQRSDETVEGERIDPENNLLWRMNRRRLDFEAMRDGLLAAAGNTDPTPGGHGVDLTKEPLSNRRTVYAFIERQNLPSIFRTFDFANPDSTSPQRFATTVPQQALFMINSPFVAEQARHLMRREEIVRAPGDRRKIQALYEAVLQRAPRPDELQLGLAFLRSQRGIPPAEVSLPVWRYGYGEYDPVSRTLKEFTPLPVFAKDTWQGGNELPDARLGWVSLTATGGHPGDARHAAVRRWISPGDVVIRITGSLRHESDKGNGVRGLIIAESGGQLGEWIVANGRVSTEIPRLTLKKGQFVDFVVDSNGDVGFDSFVWQPAIALVEAGELESDSPREWNARTNFEGPAEVVQPLGLWEKYAQVLLMSNEAVFLD